MPSCITIVEDCSRKVEGGGTDSVHENRSTSHLNCGLLKSELERKNTFKKSNNVVNKVTSEIQQQHTLSQVHFYEEQIAQKKFHQTTEAKSVNDLTAVSNWNLEAPSQKDPISTQGNQSIISPTHLSVKKQTAGPALSSQAFSLEKVFKQEGKSARGYRYSSKEPAVSQEERYLISIDEITDRLEVLYIANNGQEIVGEEQKCTCSIQRRQRNCSICRNQSTQKTQATAKSGS
ncbi:transcriptional activator DEMETER [Abeliophyllum distichum]|uniref:Transcriptional activator DEMETER n=1 Tax=Abeliophyllum distichum TaxID=126358 RepID=A0ABD1VRC2_9LAMI